MTRVDIWWYSMSPVDIRRYYQVPVFPVAAAHGEFVVTHDITKYCKAKIFEKVGKKTPMFLRFSTVGKLQKTPMFLRFLIVVELRDSVYISACP